MDSPRYFAAFFANMLRQTFSQKQTAQSVEPDFEALRQTLLILPFLSKQAEAFVVFPSLLCYNACNKPENEVCIMAIENGEWIMRGLRWDDPCRIRSWQELILWIDEIGFLPLFKNEIDGFSAEEHTSNLYWWSGDPEQDPWEWRQIIARSGRVAYGKFFEKKAGFISKSWFPHFANWRRDGYDFDSRWDEELASLRQKRIMDQFSVKDELYSFELKRLAGFGKGGEKNFEGTITDLQMNGYLLIRDFRQRLNKKGQPYGWPISVYTMPETLWGHEHISSAYSTEPTHSRDLIYQQISKYFPAATDASLQAILG